MELSYSMILFYFARIHSSFFALGSNYLSAKTCMSLLLNNPGSSNPQNNGCMPISLPSFKAWKLDEQNMLDSSGEVKMNSLATLSQQTIYIYIYIYQKAQNELANVYIKEQTEYIQNQIDKIRDSVEDRQSRIARQTVNEVSRRKSSAKAKLKATSQQDRIHLWKQHFKNLRGNPP